LTFIHYINNRFLPIFSGLYCLGLGFICILGWVTHNRDFIQVHEGLTFMVFNTCICFLLVGLILLSLYFERTRVSFTLGLILALFALLTITEYLFKADLFIDELFFKTYLVIDKTTPGRMSISTSLCFLSIGMACVFFSLKKKKILHYYFIIFFIVIIFCLSTTSVIGYAINQVKTENLYNYMPMALHTSLGFFISGLGVSSFIYKVQISKEMDLSNTLPAFAFLSALGITFLLWQADYQENIEGVARLTQFESQNIKNTVENQIEESILDLIELSSHAREKGLVTEDLWTKSTEFYKRKHPWVEALVWVDPNLHIMYEVSLNNNLKIRSQELAHHQKLFERSIINKGVTISSIKELAPNSKGIFICVPRFSDSSLQGFIVGFMNTDDLYKNLNSSTFDNGFLINLYENNKLIYGSTVLNKSYRDLSKNIDIKLYDLNWRIEVSPTQAFLKNNRQTILSYLIVCIGIFLAILLASIIRSRLNSKKQAIILKQTQNLLENQLKDSKQLSNELSLIKDMIDALQTCPSLRNAAPIIVKYCTVLYPSTSGNIFLFNEDELRLEPYVHWGRHHLKSHSYEINKVKINKYYKFECALHTSDQTKSIQCFPLYLHNKLIGLLSVIHGYYDNNHYNYLDDTVAKQLSLSVFNIKLREVLKNQAIKDPLTNLYNRRFLDESIQREFYQAKRHNRNLSVLMIDIDHFKLINDTFGHKAGDMVIKKISAVLLSQSRKGDIVCRYGGEEFLLVLPEASLKDVLSRAEQLRKDIEALSFLWKSKEIGPLTVSIGVASYPDHANTPEELVTVSDEALYKAKKSGRNRVSIDN
jgi:diguanylate cyclase (GGDEF)-like protein